MWQFYQLMLEYQGVSTVLEKGVCYLWGAWHESAAEPRTGDKQRDR
jgi:hypothetical protein